MSCRSSSWGPWAAASISPFTAKCRVATLYTGSTPVDGHQEPYGICYRMCWYCIVTPASSFWYVWGTLSKQPFTAAESTLELWQQGSIAHRGLPRWIVFAPLTRAYASSASCMMCERCVNQWCFFPSLPRSRWKQPWLVATWVCNPMDLEEHRCMSLPMACWTQVGHPYLNKLARCEAKVPGVWMGDSFRFFQDGSTSTWRKAKANLLQFLAWRRWRVGRGQSLFEVWSLSC